MKIGIVTEHYYPILGGISENVYNTRIRLEEMGHEVKIITSSCSGPRFAMHKGHAPGETDVIRIMVLAMFRAFHLNLPIIAAAVVLILSNLGIAAVSTPANLGVFELSTLAAFKLLQVDTDLALSYTIVLHMVEVIPMVLLGLAVLWLSGVKSNELLRQAELR